MTTRLSAVAKFAGVSEATVSRVLNGRPGVSQATRDVVLTALDVFGFARPEPLRTDRARLIGLVLPDLQNPIFPAFAEVIGVSLFQRGLVPVLCTRTADGVSEAHYIEMLLAQQVGGIIFVGSSYADAGAEQCRQLVERKLPIVLINAADENLGVARICVDDTVAVEQALTHLTGLGHERIGLILGPAGHVPSARKLAGFAAFHQVQDDEARDETAGNGRQARDDTARNGKQARNGRQARDDTARDGRQARDGKQARDDKGWRDWVDHTVFSVEGGRGAATRLLAAGATGLVCGSDALALGAIRAARKRGLRVPGDVSVIGFDDSSYMAVTDPPLTTMRQPVRAMAAAAVTSLLEQLDGRPAGPEVLFDPELIVRATTGPCPAPAPR